MAKLDPELTLNEITALYHTGRAVYGKKERLHERTALHLGRAIAKLECNRERLMKEEARTHE